MKINDRVKINPEGSFGVGSLQKRAAAGTPGTVTRWQEKRDMALVEFDDGVTIMMNGSYLVPVEYVAPITLVWVDHAGITAKMANDHELYLLWEGRLMEVSGVYEGCVNLREHGAVICYRPELVFMRVEHNR